MVPGPPEKIARQAPPPPGSLGDVGTGGRRRGRRTDLVKRLGAILLLLVLAGLAAWRTRGPASSPPRAAQAAPAGVAARVPADRGAADWLGRFLAADAAGRQAMAAAGLVWAEARRDAIAALIRRDPEAALRSALPFEVRAQLPPEILDRLETPVSGVGSYEVDVACDFDGEQPGDGTERSAVIAGRRYRVHTYGRRLGVTTKNAMYMHGVAAGDELALHELPLRDLSAAEKTARGLAATSVVVEAAGAILPLRDGARREGLLRRLTRAEDAVNPFAAAALADDDRAPAAAAGATLTSAWTEGAKTLLYILGDFADRTGGVASVATVSNAMNVVTQYYDEVSYGRTQIAATYVPAVVRLTNSISAYTNNFNALLRDARDGAAAIGYNYADYDLYVVLTAENATNGNFSYAGKAKVGAAGAHLVMSYYTLRTAGHELGHNYGLWHANYWRTDSDWPVGRDSVPGGYVTDGAGDEWIEYGHRFSVMSAQSGTDMDNRTAHFAAREKLHLGWLTTNDVAYTRTGGVFRLHRHDHKNATNGFRAVNIDKASTDYTGSAREYWLSYRRAFTNYGALLHGVQVDWARNTYTSDGAILLDMSPFSNDDGSGSSYTDDNADKLDGALLIGRTYVDPSAKIGITPTAAGGTAPDEWIDVTVSIGDFTNNSPPSLTLTAETNAVALNTWVTFSAAAADPDGDPLAYAWDFTDPRLLNTNALNQAIVSNRWSVAGEYVVRCVVSDMKGGVNSTGLLVRVGSPAGLYRIEGKVWWNNFTGGVEGVRVSVANTNNAYTFSDGRFILSNLKSGSSVPRAARFGYSFTPSFASPLVLGPTASNIDFGIPAPPGVDVSEAGNAAVAEGEPAVEYLVRLLSPPSGAVTLTPGTDTNQLVAPAAVTIEATNWIQGARIAVSAVEDTVYEPAAATSLVSHAIGGGDPLYNLVSVPDVPILVLDNDALVDNDGDGMIDAFELSHFGGPTNADASADADGDGFSNLGEYIAATQPTNGLSFLMLTNTPPEFVVNAASGRLYVVQAAPDLAGTNWSDVATGAGSNAPLTLVVTNGSDRLFYRLRVRLE